MVERAFLAGSACHYVAYRGVHSQLDENDENDEDDENAENDDDDEDEKDANDENDMHLKVVVHVVL